MNSNMRGETDDITSYIEQENVKCVAHCSYQPLPSIKINLWGETEDRKSSHLSILLLA